MIPVNTRELYKKPVGEHFGLYFSEFTLLSKILLMNMVVKNPDILK